VPDYEKIAESVQVPGTEAEPTLPEIELPDVSKLPNVTALTPHEFYPVNHPKYQGIAASKGYDQSNPESRINKTRYTHDAMIDVILANPGVQQKALAVTFERSVPWISRIIGSDAFQAALAKRREDLTDPFLVATIEERMKGLAFQSLDIIADKLEATKNSDLALKALDISSKALGFGARAAGPGQHNQFIIQLPPKAANAEEWAQQHSPMKQIGPELNG
jgi:hypothetical protein